MNFDLILVQNYDLTYVVLLVNDLYVYIDYILFKSPNLIICVLVSAVQSLLSTTDTNIS